MIQVVKVTYFDKDWNRELTHNAVVLKDSPKTMKLHFKNNHLFSHQSTLKKENIRNIVELEKSDAIEFCQSCSDLKHYIKTM